MFPIIYELSILKHILLIVSQLKWTWDYLLDRSFYSNKIHLPEIFVDYGDLDVKYYEKNGSSSDAEAECSICLCKIEEGDEVRELKCNHLFHSVCLDRWLGHGRLTCPLCRSHLRLPMISSSEFNREMLSFDFCSIRSSNRENWWLR